MKRFRNIFSEMTVRMMLTAGMLLVSVVSVAEGDGNKGVVVHGNVYGGGNLGDVGTHVDQSPASVGNYVWKDRDGIVIGPNTSADKLTGLSKVIITSDKAEVQGNVFGGGKGAATTFECENGMVYKTNVDISKGTVKGSVYGGGEVSRVEENTVVTIGADGTEPKIEGSVFGAGAGIDTHGYSALVRGISTVTVQGSAKVWHNVYGGGEKASVGRYKVKTPANKDDEDVPKELPYGMPAKLIEGGTCTVIIQGSAVIGKDNIENSGYVYGAGKGLEPNMNYDYVTAENYTGEGAYQEDGHKPKRMVSGNTWEHFASKDAYLQFVETLALSGTTDLTITGGATVKGSVFGGSESGFVYKNTIVKILNGTVNGDAFGGGLGLDYFSEAGRVSGNTKLTVSGGAVEGNVYGGGKLGDVGTIKKNFTTYNYKWIKSDSHGNVNATGNDNDAGNNEVNYAEDVTNRNTGVCTVEIEGGKIGVDANSTANHASGHVFGAGKGSETTWWCEKAIAYATKVTVSAGTVFGNVYGGGQVGRVEDDAKVEIGVVDASGDTSAPDIRGDVFGAGAGIVTHGYSALVRGNAAVTVQGTAQVGGSVYGGGEIASVGRFTVVGGLPKHPDSGGYCTVTIQDNAKIGTSGTVHNVFGACKGVDPASVSERKSMQLYTNRPKDASGNYKNVGDGWNYYEPDDRFVWVYYSVDDYPDFLKTLALTSHPHVTISENAAVHGSVYGGGERGLTLGNVDVDIVGGTVEKDVYGGGALADTNAGNWDADSYVEVTGLTEESSVTDFYERSGTGSEAKYTLTQDDTANSGKTYYSKGKWADATKMTSLYTTTVDLTGGLVRGDAYGGGLGQKIGFYDAQGHIAQSNIAARVWGDIEVTLNGTAFDINYDNTTDQETDVNGDPVMDGENPVYVKVVESGRVFGCNNLWGSPQGDVTVTVWKTVEGNTPRTSGTFTETVDGVETQVDNRKNESPSVHSYELAAVYGGGNLAPYTATGKKAHVIINGCGDTSILTVYGGGNAAPVPETDVDLYSCYEIGSLFGGGNGKDKYKQGTTWQTNPGANVNGNANTIIYGGTVHEAYGGSNEKGTIIGDVTIDIADSGLKPGQSGYCELDCAQLVGAGKNADVNGNLKIIMGCKPGTKVPLVFGGANNANVNGNVELTITSGNFGSVVGGNNDGGCIKGHIILNIEETTCIPINIDHLYLCGYNAAYSQYGYYVKTTKTEGTPLGDTNETAVLKDGKLQLIPRESADDPHKAVKTYKYNDETEEWEWTVYSGVGNDKCEYDAPVLNVISCTSIGEVFGGGYGTGAIVYGNPTVNINMIPGAHADEIDRDGTSGADGDADALGTIGDVYGGGDAAAVYGNTTVNIGTETMVSVYEFDNDNVNGEYVLQYEQDGVTPKTHTENVTGAYITGNVYGGGKLADVGKTRLEKDANNKDVDVVYIDGSTSVNICAVKGSEILDAQNNGTGRYNYSSVSFAAGDPGVTILGNVFGGGKGEALPSGDGAFRCSKAMVTKHTNVAIGNGTIGDGTADHGHVYGGGEKGRVQENTSVTIGCENDANSAPVISGNVFGAGKGVNTHGYSALARGNSYVTVQGESKVKKSVYGGGEIASVGKYNVAQTQEEAQAHGVDVGMPYSLANEGSGYCYVIVRDNAVIGPDAAMVMTATGYPDDMGHVFGAGKGVLPYEGYGDSEMAWRTSPTNAKQDYLSKNQAIAGTDESSYLTYVETLGLATKTYVTIDENAFIKGSVYGGSENGYVQHDTQVNIQGNCQIGNGYVQMDNDGVYLDKLETPETPMGVNRPYTAAEWTAKHLIPDQTKEPALYALVHNKYYNDHSLPECASWPYGQATGTNKYAPWDKYYETANYDSKGGRTTADDGHTFYGNVFGGGSGVIPYRPGKWHPEAGSVGGNTVVNITGGHILTNIYGGNELTDVYGKCTVNFGGTATLGVPRTLKQIAAHPLTCYLFGAGKGDQRVLFNKKTNVEDVEMNITGGTIYGSVFGGGEDGHVHRDVKMTIGNNDHSGPTIGDWGTSYVDGNVFGGGRGFGADAYTAGNVAGSVQMEIKGGSILGSIYGGGRLGSVGYGLFSEDETGYGEMRPDDTVEDSNPTSATNFKRGYIDITISGGTIGNDREYIIPNTTPTTGNAPSALENTDFKAWTDEQWKAWKEHNSIPKTEFDTTTGQLTHTKGGNVFTGGMGNFFKQDGVTYINGVDWWKLGNAKSTKLTITGGTIKSNVYGGGELGQVVGHRTTKNDQNEDVNWGTEIIIQNTNNTIIGTEVKETVTTTTTNENNVEVSTSSEVTKYTFGSVFGGGYGSLLDEITVNNGTSDVTSNPKFIAGLVKEDTKIDMQGGKVLASIYGGGEMASVGESTTSGQTTTVTGSTYVSVSGGTVGIAPITVSGVKRYFGGAKMGNVYGGGSGHNNTVRSGKIFKNTNVTISGSDTRIYHNVYGGGAYGTVGDFDYQTGSDTENGPIKVQGINGLATTGTGVATVTITGGTIGYDGKENGMVFGSSRGDINAPRERDDHTAWVYDTHVTIGTSGSTDPKIKGTVYGSGENGHTFNNTVVTVNGGKIGIDESTDPGYSVTVTNKDKTTTTYEGAEYPYRGNVYGGGCGTDKYYSGAIPAGHTARDGAGDSFNSLAGIVYGTTTVNINDGTVVRNVYGAGAMGSVGKVTTTEGVKTVSGGTTTINISGGTIGVDGTDRVGNVFGAARGDENAIINQAALVKKNTNVSITGGTINGNVYGGGELGSVGTFTVSSDYKTFTWQDTDGTANTPNNNKNTGICNVTVDGSSAVINGHVFGAGKGKDDTFWCEKGIAHSTNVNISNGTVNGNVYGGGEVGRVETNTVVRVGLAPEEEDGTSEPTINGSVFGGGAGVETHGYSALVRGNTTVTVDQYAHVEHSVYGGGEIASVGKYGLDEQKMPSILQGGGYCYVKVKGNATIGESVFGAGEGVTPHFDMTSDDHSKRSRRMTVYSSTDFPADKEYPKEGYTWERYETGSQFVWDYLQSEPAYSTYLETLALATHPEVTIDGNVIVSGSVFGGGELGLTKGSVIVNIQGGTIAEDVYGGGSLANTNTTTKADLDNDGVLEDVTPTTKVNLKGGSINRNVYGGGLGRLPKDPVGTEGADGYIPAETAVEAKVFGTISVKLNEPTTPEDDTTYGDCVVKGTIFGANNLNGSPQKDVTVHIYKTVGWTDDKGTEDTTDDVSHTKSASKDGSTYDLTAVYGGGNLAAYYPDNATSSSTAIANVIIDGCNLTSIGSVYGGGNAASVPATEVVVNGTYEIGEVFGGGNGKGNVSYDGVNYVRNPGANVGYGDYSATEDREGVTDAELAAAKAAVIYGSGKAHATIYGGIVHKVYGGSNTRGNVRVESRTTLEDRGCDFTVDEAYGGGNNAPQDGDAVLEIGCISGLDIAYGGASNADVNGDVILNLTNGTYGRVFGGNNLGGNITGSITVNIEETGCNPIIIGELYGGGNLAGYSIYGYKKVTETVTETNEETGETTTKTVQVWRPRESASDSPDGVELSVPATLPESPKVNVKSFTSIGTVYGGGYGESAKMVADPTVNINVVKGKYADGDDNVIGDNARVVKMEVVTGGNTGYPVPSHAKGAIGAINNVFGGGNAAAVIGTPHVNIGTKVGEVITLASKPIEDSEGLTPSEAGWAPSYEIVTVEGVDIRGNVYGAGNNAPVTGNTEVVIGKNNAVKTYSFTSYSAKNGGTAWSSGLAQTTGVTKNDLAEVEILSNGKYSEFVGKKFYVDPNANTEGDDRTELMNENGGSLDTPLYVTIRPFELKTYSFTSYSAPTGGSTYSTGTATATGNFKNFSGTDYMQIVVLTNPNETSWVGRKFYVPVDAKTDESVRYQLRKASGTENVWVTISE